MTLKIKKIQFYRPEFEVELARPIIGRLYLAFVFPRLIKVKRIKYNMCVKSPIHEYAGTVYVRKVWLICIPKIKVVDSA